MAEGCRLGLVGAQDRGAQAGLVDGGQLLAATTGMAGKMAMVLVLVTARAVRCVRDFENLMKRFYAHPKGGREVGNLPTVRRTSSLAGVLYPSPSRPCTSVYGGIIFPVGVSSPLGKHLRHLPRCMEGGTGETSIRLLIESLLRFLLQNTPGSHSRLPVALRECGRVGW